MCNQSVTLDPSMALGQISISFEYLVNRSPVTRSRCTMMSLFRHDLTKIGHSRVGALSCYAMSPPHFKYYE